eukprot:2836989-Lingulodinium_polyedra.AAC.1
MSCPDQRSVASRARGTTSKPLTALYMGCGFDPLIEIVVSSKFNAHPRGTKSLTLGNKAV